MSDGAPDHDDTITYAHKRVWQFDPAGWEFYGLDTTSPVANGPCPECHGAAKAAELPDTEDLNVRVRSRWLMASCHCGYPHGDTDKDGCGRYWAVPVPAAGGQ